MKFSDFVEKLLNEKHRKKNMKNSKIAPSILSAEFAKMGEEVESLKRSGTDIVHCDVMDGVFVNNITFGIKPVEDIRKRTSLTPDCHLMTVYPEKYVERFANAGANAIVAGSAVFKAENRAAVIVKLKA